MKYYILVRLNKITLAFCGLHLVTGSQNVSHQRLSLVINYFDLFKSAKKLTNIFFSFTSSEGSCRELKVRTDVGFNGDLAAACWTRALVIRNTPQNLPAPRSLMSKGNKSVQ